MRFPIPQSTSPERVVVTGAGMITALGPDWASNAEGFRTGRTGFRPVAQFDVSRQRVRQAAEVEIPTTMPTGRLGRRWATRQDRAGKMLVLAATEALASASWVPGANRVPLVLGTTSGQMAMGEAFYRQTTEIPVRRAGQPTRCVTYQAQTQAADLQEACGFTGPVFIVSNACASGANAIGHAWHLLRHGHARQVVAGGYEALSQLVFAGFDSLQALSPTACRPFDAQRDGLALGEGAAVFLLETASSAAARRARILGEVVGYAARTDLHHLTQPHPEGWAARLTMEAVCRAGGVEPSVVGYVNAHGTGTPANDGSEATAITRWAGPAAANVAVSSTKAGVGHLLGAAGAVEFGICLMVLQGGWLPPMRSTRVADPACGFRLVREATEESVEYALTNSFGFGGANASLLLRRAP